LQKRPVILTSLLIVATPSLQKDQNLLRNSTGSRQKSARRISQKATCIIYKGDYRADFWRNSTRCKQKSAVRGARHHVALDDGLLRVRCARRGVLANVFVHCILKSQLVKSQVSFAKEPYKRDYILQKRPIIWRSLLM